MSDIFISYASEDRERAREIATALTAQGWSVWWDRQIPFGKSFDTVIEENLARAKCVIVLWTKYSVESHWVRAEASDAVNRELLLPVILENDLKLPLQFQMIQAANLADSQPDEPSEEFQRMLKRVATLVGPSAGNAPVLGSEGADSSVEVGYGDSRSGWARRKKSRRAYYLWSLLILPSILILGAALGLTKWRVPTRVAVDLIVDRVAFTVGGTQSVPIFDVATDFKLLSVENFDSISFKPAKLQVADSADAADKESAISWNSINADRAVVLRGRKEDLPIITMSSDSQTAAPAGRLEAVAAEPGAQVILESVSDAGLTIRLDGQHSAPALLPLGMFRINAVRVAQFSGIEMPVKEQANAILLRAELAPDSPLIDVRGLPKSLALTLTPVKHSTIALLSKSGAPIVDIDLTRQNQSGAREPSLVAAGEIRYPDFLAKGKIVVDSRDSIGLDKLERFFITKLELDPDGKQIQLRLEGVAGHLQTLSGTIREDRRLTRLDTLWYGSKPAVMLSIFLWAIFSAVAAHKLYRELRR